MPTRATPSGSSVSSLEPIAGRPGAWRLVIAAVPDLEFELVETERVPNASIGFDCWINPRVGNLDTSHELYRLEALGDNACRLELVNTVSFSKRLRRRELESEAIKLTLSIHNALAKLKIQAEQGIEAARAADEEIVVGLECAAATRH